VFESRLVGQLGYRVPGDLARMLGKGGGRCVDLGCGTGLFGKACGELGLEWGELLGCDLSGEMCALARETGLYVRERSSEGEGEGKARAHTIASLPFSQVREGGAGGRDGVPGGVGGRDSGRGGQRGHVSHCGGWVRRLGGGGGGAARTHANPR
jgi:SAM-dependent methyltransferase